MEEKTVDHDLDRVIALYGERSLTSPTKSPTLIVPARMSREAIIMMAERAALRTVISITLLQALLT